MPAPALIFDLDGTLADTAPDLLGATNAVLAARGRPRLDLDHLRHMVGFGARALITQAMEASGRPGDRRGDAAAGGDIPGPLPRPYRRRHKAVSPAWPRPWRR